MHRMTQEGVKVSTWASVLAEIMNDWRSPKGAGTRGSVGWAPELTASFQNNYPWVLQPCSL